MTLDITDGKLFSECSLWETASAKEETDHASHHRSPPPPFRAAAGAVAIAHACSISQSTVNTYLKAAQTAGISWPLPAAWDEPRLQEALFGKQRSVERPEWPSQRVLPDFRAIHEELQQHDHLTLQLVWESIPERREIGTSSALPIRLQQRPKKPASASSTSGHFCRLCDGMQRGRRGQTCSGRA
jgi:hypothetical protein